MERDYYKNLNTHLDRVEESYSDPFFFVALYGSQNYGVDTPESDIDSKCVLIPNSRKVILGKRPISTTLVAPDSGLTSVEDIREYFKNLYKGNINFIETIYTPWALVNNKFLVESEELRDNRETIANRNPAKLIQMIQAMATSEFYRFDRATGNRKHIVEKYGYDRKCLSHLLRLCYFAEDYYHTGDFATALRPVGEKKEKIVEYKTTEMPFPEAKAIAEELHVKMDGYAQEMIPKLTYDEMYQMERDNRVSEFLDDLAYRIIKKQMVLEDVAREIRQPKKLKSI